MNTEMKKKLLAGIKLLRNDRMRLQIGAVLVIAGIALFGAYYPRAARTPEEVQSQPSEAQKQAQVAGTNANATYNPNDTPTHAGAPEKGQHMASIPGSDPEACKRGTSSGKTSAPTGLTGTIDVTVPAGCTTGDYELRTNDGHEVQWAPVFGSFKYHDGTYFADHGDDAYAVVNLPFNKDGHKGASLKYSVSVKTTAKKGTYESALYVTDSGHPDGGYKVILRIIVV